MLQSGALAAPFLLNPAESTVAGGVHSTKDVAMLRWAMGFLVLAIIAALLGFGGLASASAGIAKTLFFLFLVIFLVTLALGVAAGRKVVK